MIGKREQVAKWYDEYLSGLAIELPRVVSDTTRMSWFVYVIRLTGKNDLETVINKLGEKGIPARAYFSPIHLQAYMQKMFGYKKGDYPVTEDLGSRGLALPFSSVMSEDEVAHVANILQQVIQDK